MTPIRARSALTGRPGESLPKPLRIFISSTDAATTDIVAAAGFDFVVLDAEHGRLGRVEVEGMMNACGDALFEEVARHVIDDAEVYSHDWRSDDMRLWDNRRVLHGATGSPADEERWMLRTTIEGDYGLGRPEAAPINAAAYISV